MKATAFGKYLRKLRIEKEMLLKEMAETLNVSSAYLSSLELGKKSISDAVINKICSAFSLNKEQQDKLKELAMRSQPSVKIDLVGKSNEDREVVMSFARRYESLSEEDRKKVMKMLGE
ncbi:helix-turn-helix transcriptional regulator [uncultured Photobacterium sp.]|uniref:helix-turn-helix domain-containing protein n=1 Tax=uncultured Photobacterium sp. TaxID=173973 RepID=UPI0026302479|nr:helix-turn-helix transcriptional regulator [uncultured Photobacterium sp.]